ncbi:MAG: HD domain-containing protein [Deltaproteobacteria bacterium]|nr:HD domain-containing protein [Deltaproteobacteria bacterium]
MNKQKSFAGSDELDFRQVLEAVPDAVIVVDLDFNVRWANAAFSTLTGVPLSRAVGKKCYDVFPGKLCGTPGCPLNRIQEQMAPLCYEEDKQCGYGRSAPGLITAVPYRTAGGKLAGMVEIVHDMTPLYESREKYRKAMGGVIQAMSLAIEKRDPNTAGHQRRVTKLCRRIARELGFSWERTEGLRMAAAIHDLGKIFVPQAILNRSGELAEHERAIIQNHPKAAYEVLKDIDFPWPLAETIYQHHERMDGSGYPRGIKGESILLEARILGVADVVDAMSYFRPYRPAVGIQAALEEISKGRGIKYDPDVVDACVRVIKEGKMDLALVEEKADSGLKQ